MEIIIDKEYENSRLDKYLKKHYKNLKLGEIFKSIRTGKIKINGKKSKQNYRLQIGDKLFIPYKQQRNKSELNEINSEQKKDIGNRIVYEDNKIFIFRKNRNEVIHKGSKHEYGLVDILKIYYQNSDISFANRLDKDTSGLILGVKDVLTAREITKLIKENKIRKKYLALVKGKVKKKKFVLEDKIKKGNRNMEISNKEGKFSKTVINKLKEKDGYTLLDCELITGRTHQIRLQLSNYGTSIVGDKRYKGERNKELCLYSYYINIPQYNIEVELDMPDFIKI